MQDSLRPTCIDEKTNKKRQGDSKLPKIFVVQPQGERPPSSQVFQTLRKENEKTSDWNNDPKSLQNSPRVASVDYNPSPRHFENREIEMYQ